MKVTGFRSVSYFYEMDRPIGDANGPAGETGSMGGVLFIDTDEGITGVAPTTSPSVGALFRLIEGEDPRGVVGLWKRMVDYVFKAGNEGADNAALCAIDIALWDLKAKVANEPLWQTLGAREGRCKAYASGIDYCLSDDDIFRFYSRMADQGVDGGKLKVGLDLKADLRRIGIMDEALRKTTKRPHLAIDSNEYWSPKQAVQHIRKIEEKFDLTWAEEPARRWDYDGLRLVSRSIRAAVSSGENVNDISDFYPLIANEAIDLVQCGSGTSGITGARQVANLAFAFELPVSLMNCQANFMAHLGAALPNHSALEVVDPGREHVMKFKHHIEDGWIVLSDAPGIGIEIDEKRLARMKADRPPRPTNMPFARRDGAGLSVVPPAPGEVPWASEWDGSAKKGRAAVKRTAPVRKAASRSR